MEDPLYQLDIETSKENRKELIFIGTFFRKPYTLLIIMLMSLLASIIINWDQGMGARKNILVGWLGLFLLSILFIMYRVDKVNKAREKRIEASGLGQERVRFLIYQDYIEIKNNFYKEAIKLAYKDIEELLETRKYLIVYFNKNRASFIKKNELNNFAEIRNFLKIKTESKYRKSILL